MFAEAERFRGAALQGRAGSERHHAEPDDSDHEAEGRQQESYFPVLQEAQSITRAARSLDDDQVGDRAQYRQVARERREDIEPLARTILHWLETRCGWRELSLAPESLAEIERRDWSGNVPQLENVLARAAIAARARPILPEHLGAEDEDTEPAPAGPEGLVPLRAVLADVERRAIRRALSACGGNRTRTAEPLGISRRLLFDKIRESNLAE